MSSNPIFPADMEELKALASVLEFSCCESKAKYENEKRKGRNIEFAKIAGATVRNGDCSDLLDELVKCNKKNIYDYGRKCKSIRNALEECAAKNKVGELGNSS